MALSDIDKSPLYIDSTNGRVGIGTSSSNKSLTVATPQTANTVMEVLRLTGSGTYNSSGSSEAGAGVSFGQYSGTYPSWNLGQISGVRSGASWDGALIFSTNSGSTETSITERMRIDSSGNLLVGTTNTDPAFNNVTGQSMASTGQLQVTRDGGTAALFNRKSSNGEIVSFRIGGGTVGSIGTSSGNFYLSGASKGFRFGSSSVVPSSSTGADSDNNLDLGYSSSRFKDLYLSGGVVFGATGGAVTSKTLDDYEEGTWTPASGTITLSSSLGKYTKVGNMVFIIWQIQFPSNSDGNSAIVGGLPFNVASGQYSGTTSITNFVSTNILPMVNHSDNTITFRTYSNTTYTNANMSSKFHYGWAVYTT
jgi:hypothetical protein